MQLSVLILLQAFDGPPGELKRVGLSRDKGLPIRDRAAAMFADRVTSRGGLTWRDIRPTLMVHAKCWLMDDLAVWEGVHVNAEKVRSLAEELDSKIRDHDHTTALVGKRNNFHFHRRNLGTAF